MNKCIIQFWEESEINNEIKSDGCSLHIDNIERVKFIKEIYNSRDQNVPESYDRISGKELTCFISDVLFERLLEIVNLRLSEIEKNNLISLEEIIFKNYEIY
jgi:hypothetical protein